MLPEQKHLTSNIVIKIFMKHSNHPSTKITLVICCLFTLATGKLHAQSEFHKGESLLNLSVGLGSPFWGGLSASASPGVSYEYGITDEISVGAGFSRSAAKDKSYDIKYNGTLISLRGSYHFDLAEKFDPYVGVNLGYIKVSVKSDEQYFEDFSVGSGVGYGAFAGIRYFPVANIGIHGELGYTSLSILTIGASFRF